MSKQDRNLSRRLLLGGIVGGLALYEIPGLFAEELVRTPAQTEGPFYPDHLPLDKDNDLIVVGDSTTPAVGQIVDLWGRVLTATGSPVRGALVEIWQCDSNGAYLHTGSSNREKYDKNFQGYGRFETASTGEYRFRTIKPVPYPGRAPHIHFKVVKGGKELLVTQCYVKGEPRNERDGIYRSLRDEKQRKALTVDFDHGATTRGKPEVVVSRTARFDIVLGETPAA